MADTFIFIFSFGYTSIDIIFTCIDEHIGCVREACAWRTRDFNQKSHVDSVDSLE